MTYRQIVYMILDEVKLVSGDSIMNEDHVLFLINRYRPFLIKQYYDAKKEVEDISDYDYQEICIDLEETAPIQGDPCEGMHYLRSVQKIPKLMGLGTANVSPLDFYSGAHIILVPKNRMKFVGYNKWLKNFIYCSIGPDNHLYFRSNNPQFLYLDKVKMTAIFEDAEEANALSCCPEEEEDNCNPLDKTFAMEEHLIPQLLQLVLKEILGAAYRPADDANNDTDDLADLNTYIARNVKSNLAKQISE